VPGEPGVALSAGALVIDQPRFLPLGRSEVGRFSLRLRVPEQGAPPVEPRLGFAPEFSRVGQVWQNGLVVVSRNGGAAPFERVAALGGCGLTIRGGSAQEPVLRSSFRRGDVDDSGRVGLNDALAVLRGIFLGDFEILCPDAADANDDGEVEFVDAILILRDLFFVRGLIAAPGPEACGADPSADTLGCRGLVGCI
jgi:hypothetical protein